MGELTWRQQEECQRAWSDEKSTPAKCLFEPGGQGLPRSGWGCLVGADVAPGADVSAFNSLPRTLLKPRTREYLSDGSALHRARSREFLDRGKRQPVGEKHPGRAPSHNHFVQEGQFVGAFPSPPRDACAVGGNRPIARHKELQSEFAVAEIRISALIRRDDIEPIEAAGKPASQLRNFQSRRIGRSSIEGNCLPQGCGIDKLQSERDSQSGSSFARSESTRCEDGSCHDHPIDD